MALFHILILILGYKFIVVSYSGSDNTNSEPSFTVLNYNVRVFNTYSHLNKNFESSKLMIDWVRNDPSDIKCLQEFYNDKKSKIFNTVMKIRNSGAYQYFGKAAATNKSGGEFGLAIFSKYPIIHSGDIVDPKVPEMYAIFADIKIKKDTVRIYNVHLQSMKIEEESLSFGEATDQVLSVAGKLKLGFVSRARQVNHLLEHIRECPYQQIICGDFNDVPYSYTYFSLKTDLDNAFEKAANGFGFSYNGKLFFLRIDNQFYSKGLEASNFVTHKEIPYSDHFPIRTSYLFK